MNFYHSKFLSFVTIGLCVLVFGLLLLGTPVFAQQQGGAADGLTTNIGTAADSLGFFDTAKNLGVYITTMIQFLIIFGTIATLIFMLWGGIEYVTSGGDKSKYESARNKITYAIVGLVVMACTFMLWSLVVWILGLQYLPQLQIPTLMDVFNTDGNSSTLPSTSSGFGVGVGSNTNNP